MPTDANAPRRYIEDGGEIFPQRLAALVDADVVERTWRHWSSGRDERLADPQFRATLGAMLSAGVSLGYSIERFRSTAIALPELNGDRDKWIDSFERAVAARNALDLCVRVRSDVRESFLDAAKTLEDKTRGWNGIVKLMEDGLFYEIGIVVPRLVLLADDSLGSNEIQIDINDARLPRTFLIPSDRLLVNETVDRLALLGVRGEKAVNPNDGAECATVSIGDGEECRNAGLSTWDRIEYAVLEISSAVRHMAGAFVNTHLVQFYLDQLGRAFPIVVGEMKKALSHEGISHVLRGLVEEEISIRNLIRIFRVLTLPEASVAADYDQNIVFTPGVLQGTQIPLASTIELSLVERNLIRARSALARHVTHKYTRRASTFVVYLLDPGIERRLAHPRILSSREREALVRAVRDEFGNRFATAQDPAILTTAPIRRRLWRELNPAFPRLAMVAYQELSPDANIQSLGRIDAPELSEPFARLGLWEGGGVSPVAFSSALDDPVITGLVAARDRVIAATEVRGNHEYAKPLIAECLDAILGEAAGNKAAMEFAKALAIRADIPVEWHKIVELTLAVGRAACDAIERPVVDGAEERERFFEDVARVRSGAQRVARAVAETAIGDRGDGK
jgi:hypothetical protein